jgi:hypothetical protein
LIAITFTDEIFLFEMKYFLIKFQNLTERENAKFHRLMTVASNYTEMYFTDLFGFNVDQDELNKLILMQIFKNPEKYMKVFRNKNNFGALISEALHNSSNVSTDKLKLQSTFKKFIMSEKVFYAYFSFLWFSSLPCFDIANFTAESEGDSALLKKCNWKDHAVPCSAIFKRVSELKAA